MLVIVGILLVAVGVALPSVPLPFAITGEILVSTSGPFPSSSGGWFPGAGAFTDLNSLHPCVQPTSGTCYSQWGEVFEPVETVNVTKAVFWLWKVGTPNVTLNAVLYSIRSPGLPENLIGLSSGVSSSTISTGGPVEFHFTLGPTFTKGISYGVLYQASAGTIDMNNTIRTFRDKTCLLATEPPSDLIPYCYSPQDTSQDEDLLYFKATFLPSYAGDNDLDLGFQVWGIPPPAPPAPAPPQIPAAQNYTFPTREQSSAEKFFTWIDKSLGQVPSPSLAGIRSVIGLVGIVLSLYGLVRWKWS